MAREDQSQAGRRGPRRLSVAKASEVLGVTVEAVRGRIKRGTLQSERTEEGVFVFLEADQPQPDTDQTTDRLQSDTTALISEMHGRIEDLREQLEAERQAHAESRRLLMAALERIPPQIEAPPEAPRGAQEATDEQSGSAGPPGAQEGSRRPWWRRVFGG